MPSGRKPTPTHLRVLRGNPQHRPLPQFEPQFPAVCPPAPEHLDADARAEWDRLAPQLYSAGLLTAVDVAIFALYCSAYSNWVRACAALRTQEYVVPGMRGALVRNPWVAIRDDSFAQTRLAAAELGMTPASRSRVQTHPQSEQSRKSKQRFFPA